MSLYERPFSRSFRVSFARNVLSFLATLGVRPELSQRSTPPAYRGAMNTEVGMSDTHVTTTGAARAAKRSADTIREWARRGILKPVMTPGGIRIYRKADVERVARLFDEKRRQR